MGSTATIWILPLLGLVVILLGARRNNSFDSIDHLIAHSASLRSVEFRSIVELLLSVAELDIFGDSCGCWQSCQYLWNIIFSLVSWESEKWPGADAHLRVLWLLLCQLLCLRVYGNLRRLADDLLVALTVVRIFLWRSTAEALLE